jgi:hypothetical protein
MSDANDKMRWHLLLGRLFKLVFEPLQVQVLLEVPLVTEPLQADIVLLRRQGDHWTVEQRQWMADGLRHTDAGHLLIEFKHSEGLTLAALQQLNTYDYLYRRMEHCAETAVACFLLVASTPQGDWPERLGFVKTEWPGVYQGNNAFVSRVKVLLLNELVPTAHNAPIKCFATRRREQEKAFVVVESTGFASLSDQIRQLIAGLWGMIGMPKAAQTEEFTPDMVMAMGKKWIDATLNATPLVEILKRHKSEEVLSHYKPEQRLAGLTEEQIRAYLAKLQH